MHKKTGECIYCGRNGAVTYDHVPPRNLFAKPRPGNLVKVPSCPECHSENKQVAKDDEYFRLMLSMREDVAPHSDIKQIQPVVLRSLSRPDKVGFLKSFLKSIRDVNAMTQGGLFIGRETVFNVDLARLDAVASRITKGLFYHENGYRLPEKYEVVAYSESGIKSIKSDVIYKKLTNILQPVMSITPKVIGNQVFSYRVAYSKEDTNVSVWMLIFYDRIKFLCLTLPGTM